MRRLLCTMAIAVFALPAWTQDISCSSSIPLSRQHRTTVKHRAPADASMTPKHTTVGTVLSWNPPTGMENPKNRKIDQPFPPRENNVYTLEGDLWRVKIEDNDCDFHLEIAGLNKPQTANRIIVEVPQGGDFVAVREKILETLTANGYDTSVGSKIDLDEPLRITATGFAFFDSAHYSKKNPKKGHGHGTAKVGTLWELHPAWAVEFPGQ